MEQELYSKKVEEIFRFKLNKNQSREIQRLIYEIIKRDSLSLKEIEERIKKELKGKNPQAKDLFHHIKNILINLRFPESRAQINIDTRKIFLDKIRKPQEITYHPQEEFLPKRIIVEKEVEKSYLVERVKEKYPQINLEIIDYYSLFLKNYKLTPYNLKQPILFIVKERWDFIKPCPCTKAHLGCGYWIFNLGFGCPFDCSYCYLQQYQNFPGIILPSNLEDFFRKFEDFLKKIRKPIRIGTGEFCDSLALDDLTLYSQKLINFFASKPVLLELKTKSKKIENLLKIKPSKNIIISWSLTPQRIIDSEERATSSLQERLNSAKVIQEYGYKIAFHFDPIIYYSEWEEDYKELIDKLYSQVNPPFAWISLGTLRFNRELKSIIERRFPQSKIVYGELFIGEDKKLRYPEFMRIKIYKKMVGWIRKFDKKTPVYLCMESDKIWGKTLFKVENSKEIENYLIKNNI